GFGGKFGVQRDRQDKSALGWDHQEEIQPHASQTDYAKGFGGRYGVQKDRVDKSAAGFHEMAAPTSSYEKTRPQDAASGGTSSLRSRFENMAKAAEEESRRKAQEEKPRRQAAPAQVSPGCHEDRIIDWEEPRGRIPSLALLPTLLLMTWPPRHVEQAAPQGHAPPSSSAWALGSNLLPEVLPCCWEDEEVPPILPPRPADLGQELCQIPSQDQPIYSETLDVGEDYEELLDASDYCDGTSGGADYEELPAPLEKPEAIYDDGEDGEDMYNVYEVEGPGTCAVALYDFQGDGDDEITFDPDDTITNIEMVNEGWWRGQCRGRVGLFPANYVKLLQ
ncbi:HCLS1 protein, partial [Semnornis frantzii]|nr:HCLS1 protein [Semnornis frantzii]